MVILQLYRYPDFLGEAKDGPTNVEVTAHQLTLEQNFGQWDLLSGVFYKDSSFISTSSDAELAPARQLFLKDGQTLSRQHNQRDFQTTDLTVRTELSGTFNTGALVHHLLIGADGYNFELNKDWSRFFFFKQKTAYEISACLVGWEMCIRDRLLFSPFVKKYQFELTQRTNWSRHCTLAHCCLRCRLLVIQK